MPITPANVAEVEDLFQGIIKGELQLNPVILGHKKLMKGATKAIANAKSTNTKLIAAKETQKR